MMIENRPKDPKKLITIALVAIAIGSGLRLFSLLTHRLGPDLVDGIQGASVGVAIGMIVWAAKLGGLSWRGRRAP